MYKRVIGLFLVVSMLMCMIPFSAFASQENTERAVINAEDWNLYGASDGTLQLSDNSLQLSSALLNAETIAMNTEAGQYSDMVAEFTYHFDAGAHNDAAMFLYRASSDGATGYAVYFVRCPDNENQYYIKFTSRPYNYLDGGYFFNDGGNGVAYDSDVQVKIVVVGTTHQLYMTVPGGEYGDPIYTYTESTALYTNGYTGFAQWHADIAGATTTSFGNVNISKYQEESVDSWNLYGAADGTMNTENGKLQLNSSTLTAETIAINVGAGQYGDFVAEFTYHFDAGAHNDAAMFLYRASSDGATGYAVYFVRCADNENQYYIKLTSRPYNYLDGGYFFNDGGNGVAYSSDVQVKIVVVGTTHQLYMTVPGGEYGDPIYTYTENTVLYTNGYTGFAQWHADIAGATTTSFGNISISEYVEDPAAGWDRYGVADGTMNVTSDSVQLGSSTLNAETVAINTGAGRYSDFVAEFTYHFDEGAHNDAAMFLYRANEDGSTGYAVYFVHCPDTENQYWIKFTSRPYTYLDGGYFFNNGGAGVAYDSDVQVKVVVSGATHKLYMTVPGGDYGDPIYTYTEETALYTEGYAGFAQWHADIEGTTTTTYSYYTITEGPDADEDPAIEATKVEGEDMTIVSGAQAQIQDLSWTACYFSGNKHMLFANNTAGAEMTLSFTLEEAWKGFMSISYCKAADYGIYDIYLDGTLVWDNLDMYSGTLMASSTLFQEETALEAGEHTLKFVNVGKNANATNYLGSIDCLVLMHTEDDDSDQYTYSYVDILSMMTDLEQLAILPKDGEVGAAATSYDRASYYDEATDTYVEWGNREPLAWTNNSDQQGNYGTDGDDGIIALDVKGAGMIIRSWSASPALDGNIEIYIDGAEKPVIDMPFKQFLTASGRFSGLDNMVYLTEAQGYNNYVPITFNNSCKIILRDGWGIFYHFSYRMFEEGVTVEPMKSSFTLKQQIALQQANQTMGNSGAAPAYSTENVTSSSHTIPTGDRVTVFQNSGEGSIAQFKVKIDSELSRYELLTALQKLELSIYFDGDSQPSVWAPIGEFFASPGGIPSQSYPMGLLDDGWYYSYWFMPYADGAQIVIENLDNIDIDLSVQVVTTELEKDISEYGRFHAKWSMHRFQSEREDRALDYIFLVTEGTGRFVGLNLHVNNYGGAAWWGEGDEKFFVDGEKFPSTYGTGSEDYFGYAWCMPEHFSRAFHAQSWSTEILGAVGDYNNVRFHLADNVPFMTSFEGAIEKFHPDETTQYLSTAYFYLDAESDDPYTPVKYETEEECQWRYLALDVYRENETLSTDTNVLEGELLRISSKNNAGTPTVKQVTPDGINQPWSQNKYLLEWVNTDGYIEFPIRLEEDYSGILKAVLTTGPDFGKVQLLLDGELLGEAIDCYSSAIENTGLISLSQVNLKAGEHTLRVEVPGKNSASTGYVFGLDCLVFGSHMMTKHAAVAPTCESDGQIEHWTCFCCNAIYADKDGNEPVDNPSLKALGHSYTVQNQDEMYLRHLAVDCREKTSYWYACSNCNESASNNRLAVNEWYETNSGEHILNDSIWGYSDVSGHAYYCKYCDYHSDVIAHTVRDGICENCEFIVAPIAAHNHELVLVKATAPTCMTSGNVAYYICTQCSEYFDNGGNVISDRTSIVVPASAHNYVAATCTTPIACQNQGCSAFVGKPLGHCVAEWSFDVMSHWHVCLEDGCAAVLDKEHHTDTNTDYLCDVCGYAISVDANVDFETYDGWSYYGRGSAKIVDGELQLQSSTPNTELAVWYEEGGLYKDFTAEFTYHFVSGEHNDAAMFLYRASKYATTGYAIYFVRCPDNDNQYWIKFTSRPYTYLDGGYFFNDDGNGVTYDSDIQVKVVVSGGTHSLYMTVPGGDYGDPIYVYTEETPQYTEGYVGFIQWHNETEHELITAYDNFKIEENSGIDICGQQLVLGDDLTMKFEVAVDEQIATDATIMLTVGDAVVPYDLAEMQTNANGNYVVSVDVAAAQMTEDILLTVELGDIVIKQRTYTVLAYANAILNGYYSNSTKSLVKEMLNYGAKAQTYFAYNTDKLANAGYENDITPATMPTTTDAVTVDGSVSGITYYGSSMIFTGKLGVRYYFNISGNSADYTFTANGKTYTAKEKDGLYYIEVNDINPQDIDESVLLEVSDGNNTLSVGYGPMNYIVRMYEKGSENLKNLLQALYGYHLAAEEYVLQPAVTESNLYQKAALFSGDSISYGHSDSSAYRAWAGRIGEKYDMEYVNVSVSGASVSTARETNRMISQIQQHQGRNFDLVVLHGGTNDAWDNVSVGQMTDSFDVKDFDTTTFAGGLEELLYYVKQYYPDAKIGYVINFRFEANVGIGRLGDMTEYVEMTKAICDKWDIPYLDLYNNETLNTSLAIHTREFVPDRIHPNRFGYNIITPYIEEWLSDIIVA